MLMYLNFISFFCFVSFVYTQDRIIGGIEVKNDNYPYQLSIRKNNVHICGGALIGEKHGLSAAHCFTSMSLYSVKAGSNLKDSGGNVSSIKTVFLHPERRVNNMLYDIAILELVRPFKFGMHIQPVNLPDNDHSIIPGIKGIISGFGDTDSSENTGSNVLRAAAVPIVDSSSCRDNYSRFGSVITSMVFCAGEPSGGIDSCQGDSGGPFVIDNVLYGLVSYGVGCGDPDYPGVYTNVARYREFIRLNTGI